MSHGEAGSNTLSFDLKSLKKASMKPVKEVTFSLELLKLYVKVECGT